MSNMPKPYSEKSQFEQLGSKVWLPMSSPEIVQCFKSRLESFTTTILLTLVIRITTIPRLDSLATGKNYDYIEKFAFH